MEILKLIISLSLIIGGIIIFVLPETSNLLGLAGTLSGLGLGYLGSYLTPNNKEKKGKDDDTKNN